MDDLVQKAEREIAEILAKLERDTGMLVRNLAVTSIEVTQMQDDRPQHVQKVCVEMYRLPGHLW